MKLLNVMLTSEGEVKVTDFGLSREVKETITRVSGKETSGTMEYSCYQQLMGESPHPNHDIYSLGICVYECLNGSPPFTRGDIGRQHQEKPPPLIEGVPGPVMEVILKALAKEPGDRYKSASEFVDDFLVKVKTSKPSKLSKPPKPPKPVKPPKQPKSRIETGKTKKPFLLAGIIGAVALAVIIWVISQKEPEIKPIPKEDTAQVAPVLPEVIDSIVTQIQPEEVTIDTTAQYISSLLTQAEALLNDNKLTSPKGNNAYDLYKQILQLEPLNQEAKNGRQRIADKYESWGDGKNASGDWNEAVSYYEKSIEVGGSNSAISQKIEYCENKLKTITFKKTFGGSKDDYCYSVIQTSDGGFLAAGYTKSYGAGESDFWLIKTDKNGNKIWDRTFGGSSHDECNSVIQTSDGGFLAAGYTQSYGNGWMDFWFIKTDSRGYKIWDKTFGGIFGDECNIVIQKNDRHLLAAGYTYSFGTGGGDFWLIKIDKMGNRIEDKTFGGSIEDCCSSLIQINDKGFLAAGYTYSYGAGLEDFWLIKIDSQGNKIWDKTFGGSASDVCISVIQTTDGGFLAAGSTSSYGAGKSDFWLIKMDGEGNVEE